MRKLFTISRVKSLLLLLFFSTMSSSLWAYDFMNRWAQEIQGVTYYYDMWYNITDVTNHYVEVTFESENNGNYNSYNESTEIAIPITVTHPETSVVYTVTAIGDNAFKNCTKLEHIYLSNVTSIGAGSFAGCTSLTGLTFTTVIKTIGNSAFAGCTGLSAVTIPAQLTSIGQSAFANCTGLANIYYSATECNMSSYIFQGCTHDCTLYISNNVPGIPDGAFYYFPGLKTIVFGTHENFYIGGSAFYNCAGLTSVTIPDNVTSIGAYAFYDCTGLTEITLGTGLQSIGDRAFQNCTHLATVNYNATNFPDSGIGNTATLWSNCNTNCTANIGANVTRLPQCIFNGFTSLKAVNFSDNPSLTTIGSNAFASTGLTSVTIPNTVQTIGSSAFSYCQDLTSLDLGKSVTTIESNAFSHCTGLTSLTIPATVTAIQDAASANGAFWDCSNLQEIWFMGATRPAIDSYVFADVPTDIPVYVPKGYSNIGSFTNYKYYLHFVGGNSNNNWKEASNWTGACTGEDTYVHSVPATDEIAIIDGNNDPVIPDLAEDEDPIQVYKIYLNNGRKIKILEGGQLLTDQALQVEVEKEINEWTTNPVGGWYFIASPINASLRPEVVVNLITPDDANGYTFDLYSYDATNGEGEGDPRPWMNYRAHSLDFRIENGCGYLYANKGYRQLYFTGETKPYSEEGGANKVALAHDGWNLIGNPFTCNVSVSHSFSELNHENNVTAKNGGSIIAPCAGIAVYGNEGDQITFRLPLQQQSQDPSSNSLNMVLTKANMRDAKQLDNVIVSFDEDEAMPKFNFMEQDAKIYIPQDGKEYAIVHGGKQGVMSLNFEANENGEYTLTVSETFHSQLSTLHLIDNLTGADIDLLATPSYQFTARKTDFASRFKLVFRTNSVDDIDDSDDTFAYYSDGQIYLVGDEDTLNATMQVIDITGRIVVRSVGANVISTNGLVPGVYTIQMVQNNQVRNQKIIIK